MPGLGFFELLPVGIGILAIGITFHNIVSSRMLGAEPGAALSRLMLCVPTRPIWSFRVIRR